MAIHGVEYSVWTPGLPKPGHTNYHIDLAVDAARQGCVSIRLLGLLRRTPSKLVSIETRFGGKMEVVQLQVARSKQVAINTIKGCISFDFPSN